MDECSHGRPDHQVMIRELADALGLDLPAISLTPKEVWDTLIGIVKRKDSIEDRCVPFVHYHTVPHKQCILR